MVQNKLLVLVPALLATVLTISAVTGSAYAQSTDQTMQDVGQAANKTGEAMKGNASEALSNVTEGAKEIGKNVTEGAKGLAESIGEGIKDLMK